MSKQNGNMCNRSPLVSWPSDFGERLIKWGLRYDNHPEEKENLKGMVTLDGEKFLEVSLGYWNKDHPKNNSSTASHSSRGHMELILQVTLIDHITPQDDREEKIVGTTNQSSSRKRHGRNSQQQKPIWTMNCHMGGDDGDIPLVLVPDVSKRRPWDTTGIQKEWLEVYRMKASSFVPLLQRFIRWGYAVGSLSTTTTTITSTSSVALLSTRWMQEAGHHIMQPNATGASTIRQGAIQEVVAPKLACHINSKTHNKWFSSVFKKKKKTTGASADATTIQLLIGYLSSDTVTKAMEMNDKKVSKQIEAYQTRNHSSKRRADHNNGPHMDHTSVTFTMDEST